jgi:GAF domain-containing protein
MNLRLLDALSRLADGLVEELVADACALSRVIGEVLILVAERVPDGGTLQQGQGYLVSDYPLTEEVLLTKEPRALTLDDPVVDEAEARLLRELGFGALLMTPLELNGEIWGLVEVYRLARQPFTEAEINRALELSRVT